jgi:drug/metabolite transporter (DMT)-like permease
VQHAVYRAAVTASTPSRRAPISGPLAGALMMALAAAAFSVMHAAIRHVSTEMHPFEIAFFRVVFGFVALAPIFLRDGWAPLKTANVKLFALRGVLNSAAMLMFFYSLAITPLATVAALSFSAKISPRRAFSSGVVRMSVMLGFHL